MGTMSRNLLQHCKKCKHVVLSDCKHGTENMNRHIKKCQATTYQDVGQMDLSYSESSMLTQPSKFDHEVFS
ncbi:hypothetical protein AQUCO_00500531v1 [Aquilegia coerulea]|uniref:BED-type domain-containing protein n=1 Tax=Aquilegia coerulea TaxID=218851 RepID=A0A2G5ESC6_AQUCA|nr:hypothetical protein AQUCO_00500531v1 [Aquilegia coerulea]